MLYNLLASLVAQTLVNQITTQQFVQSGPVWMSSLDHAGHAMSADCDANTNLLALLTADDPTEVVSRLN